MKINNETQKHDYRYHNTELLLKKYRDVVWSIEVSLMHSKLCFELEMGCSLEEFVSDASSAGADLTGTNLQEYARTMERNKKMLHIIDASINTIKEKHPCGDLYYWILYFSYLSPKPIKKIDDIINEIEKQGHPLSWKTYFRKRQEAIDTLSNILWGFASKECIHLLEQFTE